MESTRKEVASTLQFVDEASIFAATRAFLKQKYETEKCSVLAALPDGYKARFRTAGFCRDKPVQILGPYDVPPGETRKKWLEKFKVSDGELPYLVYWLTGNDDMSVEESITIEAARDVLRCDGGTFPIPSEIRKKIILEATLSEEDKQVMTSVKMAQQIEDSPGMLLFDAPPDYECYGLVPKEKDVAAKRLPQLYEKISVFWKCDKAYYPGFVSKRRGDFFMIQYNDGDAEWLLLTEQRFQLCDPPQFVDEVSKNQPARRQSMNSDSSERSAASSGSQNPSLLVRTKSDGCIAPTKPPKRNSEGRFVRPPGRPPNGFTWNSRRGVWVQAISNDSVAMNESPPKQAVEAKRPKQSSVVSKEESVTKTTSAGEPSSEYGLQKEEFKGSRTESLLKHIVSTFGNGPKGKVSLESVPEQTLAQTEGALNELISMDLDISTLTEECPLIFKVLKKLTSSRRLGSSAVKLYCKLMVAFDRDLIAGWGTAIEERNVFLVNSKVHDLKARMQQKKFALQFPAKHITNEELQALVSQTDLLLKGHASDLSEIEFIKSVMDYRCVKLES